MGVRGPGAVTWQDLTRLSQRSLSASNTYMFSVFQLRPGRPAMAGASLRRALPQSSTELPTLIGEQKPSKPSA